MPAGGTILLMGISRLGFSPKGGGGNKQKRRKHGKNPPESVIFSSISPPTDTRYQGGPFEFWKSGCFPCGKSGGIADFPPISWTCRLGALTGEQLGPPSCWPVSDPQRPAAGQSAAWLTGQLPQQASWAAYQQATWVADWWAGKAAVLSALVADW